MYHFIFFNKLFIIRESVNILNKTFQDHMSLSITCNFFTKIYFYKTHIVEVTQAERIIWLILCKIFQNKIAL